MNYVIQLRNGNKIEVNKNIRLFRPKLRVKLSKEYISIEPKTGYVKGRLNIKNIGRGLQIIRIKTAGDSQCKIYTPPDYQEWISKFNADVTEELKAISEKFVQFKPFMEYLVS